MRLFAAIALLLTVSSCNLLEFRSGDEVVAHVGEHYLYKEDIKNLIPHGTSYSDSIMMVRQYINSWALKYLLLSKAEAELSKTDKDVEGELRDYRTSLLVYRYEKQYIEKRLDTLVSDQEARAYYQENSETITVNNSVVKARVIKVSSSSPNLSRLKSMYRSDALEDIDELERISYNSAERYNNFDNKWVDLSFVARELPLDLYRCEEMLKSASHIEAQDSLYSYFAYFPQRIAPNGNPPFEYYLPRIKEIIISRRKQALIAGLEKDLIKEALENNKIKLNINDNTRNEE
ncbi:MAG: hypothetical protein A2X19_08580 [Bacteroidetes bacterium GWE2_39_28]|nr:MAG: hypothetical protein A2X19_08580 [Bacteroidetes bacterium GWE2_39_28]OFZ07926.1 MAG: hypothetical protein A2322_08305 [Bacteroidetes bacterium RIFOXYB2_FULL_39_7]OFZ12288.1 MAG: hypothetical protein A2465_10565 [Bacteroidetes bacterium RIFOXYC2_FULL_39_11]HCT94264.1 hypothetical protein [Rikenellaceae bacterium]